jgi:hypothetical protein
MKKYLVIFLVIITSSLFAQNKDSKRIIENTSTNDTFYTLPLKEVVIKSKRKKKSKRHKRRTDRLIRYVKKVYPYAKLAAKKLDEYDAILKTTDKKSQRRRIMRKAEKEIKKEFGADLKKLTFTQGKILLKLIDRETGNSSYELLKELRGGFTVFFYQAFARIFGFNLKDRYDPKAKDWKIEQIVQMIENGTL